MRIRHSPLLAVAVGILVAAPCAAQRLRFERAIDVTPGATLEVSTIRGKVAVRADDGRQIRIDGTVTVRAGVGGLTVPSNALELAQRVADHPRIDVADNVVRLRPPIDADELRAVTVSYEVRVPRDTRLVIATDSGARRCDVTAEGPDSAEVTVDMGIARLAGRREIEALGRLVAFDVVDCGNPHAVTFEPFEEGEIDRVGPVVSVSPAGGTNVEFCRVTGDGAIDVVVWGPR